MPMNHRAVLPRGLLIAAAVAALGLRAPEAAADPIAYTMCAFSGLCRVDLDSFEIVPVGSTSVLARELAFHADGTLYGLEQYDLDALRLSSFDVTTGAGTVVAEFDLGFPFAVDVVGFTGDAAGNLWGLGGYLDAQGDRHEVVFAIDPVAGSAGDPVELDRRPGQPELLELAACGDRLLANGVSGLTAIDPLNGRTSILFALSPRPSQGIGVGPDGGLWSVWTIGITGSPSLFTRMDLLTGEITEPGGGFGLFLGLAVAPPPAADCVVGGAPLAIPTLSPLALAALAATLAVAALWIARRRA